MSFLSSASRSPSRGRRFGLVVVLLALALTLGVMITTDPAKTPFIIAASVLGSLVASMIALWVNLVVLDDPSDRVLKAADAIARQVEQLQVAAAVVAQSREHGFETVKPKSAYSPEEWMEILSSAEQRLLLVGHALDKWCADDFKSEFSATLERLAKARKRVQILTLPADGANTERLHQQRGLEYRARVETTLKLVGEVYRNLPSNRRAYLDVRALEAQVDMPYMVVSNERFLVTSAYPTTAQSSGAMLAVKVKTQTTFERALREDVKNLFDRHASPVELATP